MELAGFDPHREQDDWMRTRPSISSAQTGSTIGRRARLVVSALAVAVLTTILVGVAIWQTARIHRFLSDVQQLAAEYTSSRSTPEQAARATPAQKTAHTAKRRVPAKPVPQEAKPPEVTPVAAHENGSSQFVEVIDPSNRHYLVRPHAAPISSLPGEQLPQPQALPAGVRTAAATQSAHSVQPQRLDSISLRAHAPGSAGIVVLRGLVRKDGTIGNLEIVSGPPELASAAAEAAQRWHYVPEYYNGHPVERLVEITVDFTVLLSHE
jgi:outer membrane biosynthesis protein TonB